MYSNNPLFVTFFILHWVVFVLTLAVFIYGVTSWFILKRFRNFKNYVYLSAIFANVSSFAVLSFGFAVQHTLKTWKNKTDWSEVVYIAIAFHLFVYFKTVYNYWLVVICYIFYVDIVKVFNTDIRKKYLKSSLFAWALPFLVSFVTMFLLFSRTIVTSQLRKRYPNIDFVVLFFVIILVIPLLINCLIYLRIIRCLFCRVANSNTATENWRRFYMATLIFVMSDMMMVSGYILYFYFVSTNYSSVVLIMLAILLYFFNSIAMNVFFVVVKSNRELWREYIVNRSRLNSLSVTYKSRDNMPRQELTNREHAGESVTSF